MLTVPQYQMLCYLETRQSATATVKPGQLAMLRRMEEQGLVGCRLGWSGWYIKAAGRDALRQEFQAA